MKSDREALFNIYEAAEMTRMSIAWWRQAVFQKKLKYLKVGRRILIPESTIEELLSKSVVKPRTNMG